jgi:type IV pilus assembly protein PilZ
MIQPKKMNTGRLNVSISDKNGLHLSYMPFILNGGLFVKTKEIYTLGDEVLILLSLLDEPKKVVIAGKIIWITPKNAQGAYEQGVGVQFNAKDPSQAQKKIETYLVGALKSERPTYTM